MLLINDQSLIFFIREPFLAQIQLLNHKLVAESRCLRNAINKLVSTCRSFFPLECSNILIEQFQVTKFCNRLLFRKSMSKVVLNLLSLKPFIKRVLWHEEQWRV